MKNPGDPLNVPCDWCDKPSVYSNKRINHMPIYLYSCGEHKEKLETVVEEYSYKKMKKPKKVKEEESWRPT